MKKGDSENSVNPFSHIEQRYSPSHPVYGWVRQKEAAGDSANEGKCAGNDEAAESRPICG
ncbi:MAG: hypothetical protein WBW34_03485 [Nitrososphaeraceae archaeon]